MKFRIYYLLVPFFLSCKNVNTEKLMGGNHIDSIQPVHVDSQYGDIIGSTKYDPTQNLKLSIPDTIKRFELHYFSNKNTKDIFLLTIEPGMVKNSKSKFEIMTSDKKVIYTQPFNTNYFVRGIYQPEYIPKTGSQEEYDKFLRNYWITLTTEKYLNYFNTSVDSFFNAFSFISEQDKRLEIENFQVEEYINDNDFLNEVKSDTTIQLINIDCFDCDEGVSVIGYSKKQKKVITSWNTTNSYLCHLKASMSWTGFVITSYRV